MTTTTDLPDLRERLRTMARGPGRTMVALAGPPGAGKSHVTDALLADLPGAALLPMDDVLRRLESLAGGAAPATAGRR